MNHYNIAFICDDAYVMPTMVSIESLIENNVDKLKLSVYVCTFGLSELNITLLEQMSNDDVRVIVKIINIENYKERLSHVTQRSHVSPSALIKFELPNIFSDLDTILYLDSDIVVCKSLKLLFETDVKNVNLACSYEFWKYWNSVIYEPKRKRSNEFYFNSGVMYFNLDNMRKKNIVERLWDDKINNITKSFLMDQDCFNNVCKSDVVRLSIKWNFNPEFYDISCLKHINTVYGENYVDIKQMLSDVCIIHYVGKTDKPWKYKNAKLGDIWLRYYEMLFPDNQLNYNEVSNKKDSMIEIIKSIYKSKGFMGTLMFIRYSLKKRISGKF